MNSKSVVFEHAHVFAHLVCVLPAGLICFITEQQQWSVSHDRHKSSMKKKKRKIISYSPVSKTTFYAAVVNALESI